MLVKGPKVNYNFFSILKFIERRNVNEDAFLLSKITEDKKTLRKKYGD